jgi:hypothetical protein
MNNRGDAMSNVFPRLLESLRGGLLVAALALCACTSASAEMLVELALDATSRPYTPEAPPSSVQQQFSVPGGEGQLIMTFTEEEYVGGPGGFSLEPNDLSPEYLGWGGSTEYTPHDPMPGQPYKVQTIWRHSFSKKVWLATLTARHAYQSFQIRDRGEQIASRLRLTVEFVPSTPADEPLPPPQTSTIAGSWDWGAGGGIVEIFADGTGHDSRGNSMRWTLLDAARGVYELRWSHGFTDMATLSPEGNTISVVNNVGTSFVATRRAAQTMTIVGSWDWGAGGGVVEISADGTGHDSRGNSMRWTARDAARGVYELRWSHGYTDTATLSPDGNTISIVNNAGTSFMAVRRH